MAALFIHILHNPRKKNVSPTLCNKDALNNEGRNEKPVSKEAEWDEEVGQNQLLHSGMLQFSVLTVQRAAVIALHFKKHGCQYGRFICE